MPPRKMPPPEYLKNAPMRIRLAGLTPGVYEEQVDHVWLNILRYYFRENSFSLEREAYVDPLFSKMKTNISVCNVRNGQLQKVLFVEAKRFPLSAIRGNWHTYYRWKRHKPQLRRYMLRSRTASHYRQTMYGMLAVGDRVKFYQINMVNNPAGDLTPYIYRGTPLDMALSIQTDGLQIQRILKHISLTVRRLRNNV
ncbi:hypothetical protein Plec18170_004061 [Paecilomyces lecythidis]